MVTVSTKSELERAKDNGEPEIIVLGALADKLKNTKKIATLGAAAIASLVAVVGVATVTAPETFGLSYVAVAPVAALTGVEISAIIVAASLGIALILAIFKEYEEISYEGGKLILKKKSK